MTPFNSKPTRLVSLILSLMVPALVLCQHRGYFILRVISASQDDSPFSNVNSPEQPHIIIAPDSPLLPLSIVPQPSISPCPLKPAASYDPSSVWLADWRLPITSPLDPGSSVRPSSFFSGAKEAMDEIVAPMLRSLKSRTRTLAWGYLTERDDQRARGLRVTAIVVPDSTRSTPEPSIPDGNIFANTVQGVGVAENVIFVDSPTEPYKNEPKLRPACKGINNEEWHLFRNPADSPDAQEDGLDTLYSQCHGVYIEVERVLDEEICFRWDLSTERDELDLAKFADRRLFTLYHNSWSGLYPVIITPEIDEIILTGSQIPQQQPISDLPRPSTPDLARSMSEGSVISNIETVADDDNASFAEDLEDFMGRRGTSTFRSRENSGSGRGPEVESSSRGRIWPRLPEIRGPGGISMAGPTEILQRPTTPGNDIGLTNKPTSGLVDSNSNARELRPIWEPLLQHPLNRQFPPLAIPPVKDDRNAIFQSQNPLPSRPNPQLMATRQNPSMSQMPQLQSPFNPALMTPRTTIPMTQSMGIEAPVRYQLVPGTKYPLIAVKPNTPSNRITGTHPSIQNIASSMSSPIIGGLSSFNNLMKDSPRASIFKPQNSPRNGGDVDIRGSHIAFPGNRMTTEPLSTARAGGDTKSQRPNFRIRQNGPLRITLPTSNRLGNSNPGTPRPRSPTPGASRPGTPRPGIPRSRTIRPGTPRPSPPRIRNGLLRPQTPKKTTSTTVTTTTAKARGAATTTARA
ncbi:hypothetical protein DRE_00942 [Drechslerella stenobrocha 248]|uniref:Uncharacterized protein n=1 Tax=Drechslerella stenobrocha 248 TaxID=1043628 RepID=W7HY65_9PEZI|nr:hypothetical protein DRE_00942 [Drechslerella stenobrocha 248]